MAVASGIITYVQLYMLMSTAVTEGKTKIIRHKLFACLIGLINLARVYESLDIRLDNNVWRLLNLRINFNKLSRLKSCQQYVVNNFRNPAKSA